MASTFQPNKPSTVIHNLQKRKCNTCIRVRKSDVGNKRKARLNYKQDFNRARAPCGSYLKIWNSMKYLCQTQVMLSSPSKQLSRHRQLIPLNFCKKYETILHGVSEGENYEKVQGLYKEFGLQVKALGKDTLTVSPAWINSRKFLNFDPTNTITKSRSIMIIFGDNIKLCGICNTRS